MSVFFTATVSIKDQEKFKAYADKAGDTVRAHGGEFLGRGRSVKTLGGGEPSHDFTVVIQFADMDSLDNWYGSDEYQSIIPLRNEGADVSITVYDSV